MHVRHHKKMVRNGEADHSDRPSIWRDRGKTLDSSANAGDVPIVIFRRDAEESPSLNIFSNFVVSFPHHVHKFGNMCHIARKACVAHPERSTDHFWAEVC